MATTRPETMLGDTAIAVHPDDARYKVMRLSGLLYLSDALSTSLGDLPFIPSFPTAVYPLSQIRSLWTCLSGQVL